MPLAQGNLRIKNPSLFCALDWFHRGLEERGTREGISCFIVRLPLGNLGETRSEGRRKEGQDKTRASCPHYYKSFLGDTDLPRSILCDNIRQSQSRARKEKAFHASTGTDDNERRDEES